MKRFAPTRRSLDTAFGPFVLLALLVSAAPAAAQAPTDPAGPGALNFAWPAADTCALTSPPRSHRIRLFRITPGFISDPLGLEDDDDPGASAPAAAADGGPDWIEVTMGNDNPYFDFRQPGDPGGLGFYKVCTQVQLLDSATTGCAFNLQAVTPAGIQFNGLLDGPTVFSPALSMFQNLGGGNALQGFVAKNLPVTSGGLYPGHVRRSLQYGLALQRPLLADPAGVGNVYLFVETLGQYRTGRDFTQPLSVWELLPGMHWQMNDSTWISSGLMLPVGNPHVQTAHWQLTCAFQF